MLLSRPAELLRRWLLATACFGLLIFFFSPSWGAFSLWSRVPEMQGMLEVRRGASLLEQMDSPGAAITDPLHRAIQWRLLFPVVGHLLHLPPAALFGLAPVGCLLVLAYLATLSRRAGLAWRTTSLSVVTLGAASWFFTSTGWLGYFDSWLVLALLFVAFGRTGAVIGACLWAPWIDERFVLAAPLALLCRWAHARATDAVAQPDTGLRGLWMDAAVRRELAIVGGLLGLFVLSRLVFLSGRSAEGATLGSYLSSREFLDAPISRIALGVWEGLRGGWWLAILALARNYPARSWRVALGLAVLLTAGIGLATAQDYGRSISTLLPVAVLGLLQVARSRPPWLDRVLLAGAALTLLLPAHHVMNDRVNPIFYLYHELAALKNPPPAAMPDLYELRAIHAMERGDFAAAEQDLELAIRLSAHPVSPSRQRGILRASQGRWAEAHRDFSAMVDHAPENPDAWFMRAQSNFALGNPVAARADYAQAQSLAAPGWVDRADVRRFSAKLNEAAR